MMSMPPGVTFTYNGLGDRMQQTYAGNTTTYLLDIASYLTQVLGDGESTYLYGLGRIGEEGAGGWQYHHADALGSVRQLTDPSGAATLAKSYRPYGELLNSAGDADTPYDFAGEWRDNTGLIYLRARYYQATVGRFLSRDTWGGDYSRPNTLNLWNYGYSNPILFTDPSGKDPIGECFGFFVFAFAEPTLIGEGAAIGCLIILGIAATTLLIAHNSEEFVESCEVAWDVLVEPLVRPKPGVTYPSDTIVRGVDPFTLPKIWPTPEPNPRSRVGPEPIIPPLPTRRESSRCDPTAFTAWWRDLPEVPESYRPGEAWYEYEQRVARASGVLGYHARTVLTGPVDADGIEPSSCQFIEAKYSPDPIQSQFRPGDPPWLGEILNEFQRYRSAIMISNGIPNAQPRGLIVRTNHEIQSVVLEELLLQAGFMIGINGIVQIVP